MAVLFCAAWVAQAAQTPPTNRPPAEVVIPKSIFVTNNPAGKDPFFPNRQFMQMSRQFNQDESTPKPVGVGALRLLGITTDTAGKRIALINNLTFAEGEANDEVRVENVRVKVRCVEIREKSVIVTLGEETQQHELVLPERLLRSSPE